MFCKRQQVNIQLYLNVAIPLTLTNSMKKNLQKSGLNFIVCNVLVISSSAIFSKFMVTVALYNITIYVVRISCYAMI
jgi:hypothetical protein